MSEKIWGTKLTSHGEVVKIVVELSYVLLDDYWYGIPPAQYWLLLLISLILT
jgi:hypothetical protein